VRPPPRAAQQVALLSVVMLKPQKVLADGWLAFLPHMLPQGSAARAEQRKQSAGGAGQFWPWAVRQSRLHAAL